MPSNFEIAVIALLAINFILTIYYNYRSQENYASVDKPKPPIVNVSYDSIKNGYNLSIMPYPGEKVLYYKYSMNGKPYVYLPANNFIPFNTLISTKNSFTVKAGNSTGESDASVSVSAVASPPSVQSKGQK